VSAGPPSPRPPASAVIAWRTCVAVLLFAVSAVVTQVARGLTGGFGMGPGEVATLAAASFVGILAIVPMGAMVDLPEAMWCHWIPERRWRAGRCPACGHDGRRARCPECGAEYARPAAYASDWSTLRRTAAMLGPAWVLGLIVGMAFVVRDERRFRNELDAFRSADPQLREESRPRRWPAGFASLHWDVGRGFSGPPPFSAPKEPLPFSAGANRSTNSGLSTK